MTIIITHTDCVRSNLTNAMHGLTLSFNVFAGITHYAESQ